MNSAENSVIAQTASLILIVDDQPDNIEVLAILLETHGYSVTYALNGKEALQRLNAIKPDLILLDLFMPKMNGLEVCETIKADKDLQEIPILFLTASHENEHMVAAFEKGAADYVVKPFRPTEILARAQTHIKLRKQQVKLQQATTKLHTIVNNIKDGVIVIDEAGLIQFANPAATRMFDQPLDNLLNHPLGLPIIEKHLGQIEIHRSNGEIGIAEFTVAEAEWDIQPAWIVCLRDITDREGA